MKRQRVLQQVSDSSAANAGGASAMRGQDLQTAMECVAALAGDNPVQAFEAAMHAVTSQLAHAVVARDAGVCPPCADCRPGQVGLLHRRSGNSMHCFPALGMARHDSGWTLSAPDLLGICANPGKVRAWYVLSPGAHGGMQAFRIDANAAGLRFHPARAGARGTPFNAHALSLDQVRVPDHDAWDLGHPHSPNETFMRLVSVYRAMAAALCYGLGRATRGMLVEPAAKTRDSAAARRPQASQQLGKIDALLLTSDIVVRGIASEFTVERGAAQRLSPRLHRLAVDSSLAAVSLAWRGGMRQAHAGVASLHRYRRDALAIGALMTVLDGVGAQDRPAGAADSPSDAPHFQLAAKTGASALA